MDLVWLLMEAVIVEKQALQLSDCERAVSADRLLLNPKRPVILREVAGRAVGR
jgi:hypothetical protein